MSQPIVRNDLKIVYFHLTNQDEDEVPIGCIVVHKPTGFSGIGEEGKTAQENLMAALTAMAPLAKVPLPAVEALFKCPQCNQERLPDLISSGWKAVHSFEYIKNVKVNDLIIGYTIVFKTVSEPQWDWLYLEDLKDLATADPQDSAYFVEDAIAAANEEAAKKIVAFKEKDVSYNETK